jgi:hypothetical protein
MNREDYKPLNPDAWDEMTRWFEGAKTMEELSDRVLLYVLAPPEQYPRQDISYAQKFRERELYRENLK